MTDDDLDLSPPTAEEVVSLVPQPNQAVTSITLSIRPEIAEILTGGASLMKTQLEHYAKLMEKGPLSPKDMEIVTKMMDAGIKLSREERELRKRDKPFTEEELMATVRQMLDEGVIDVGEK